MLAINQILVESSMRRSLIGARATDPVVPERQRVTRGRATAAAQARRRARFIRTPASPAKTAS